MDYAIVAAYGVVAFGFFVSAASLLGLIYPSWLAQTVHAAWRTKPSMAMTTAVIARLLLGTMLIYFSRYSRLPTTFLVVGALGIVAAIGLPLFGWKRIDDLMGWLRRRPTWMIRTWLVVGVSAGGLLIYGALPAQ